MDSASVSQGVICPCCDGRFASFEPYGVAKRPNARCPRCGSKARHRLIWLYLQNETNLLRDRLTLVHFAAEKALRRRFASLPNLHYVIAGLEDASVTLRTDVTQIACRDRSADVILCSDVLEHVPEDKKAMRELARILKPGGYAIIRSPVDPDRECTFEDGNITTPEARLAHFGQSDHVRIYGRDFQRRLQQAGFIARRVPYGKLLGVDAQKRYGLKERHTLYVCTKEPS